jgi:iron complex transport system substrate-binding protein
VKIVSLLPSATEIVYALGLGDSLEGVTYECDHPNEARSKPVVSETALPSDRPMSAAEIDGLVGAFMDRREPIYRLNKDLIQRIQPDLILTQDLCRVCAVPSGQVNDALAELGCRADVVSLDPHSVEGILDAIVEVGRATGAEVKAKEVVEGLRDRIQRVKRDAGRLLTIGTFALEWSDPPFVAGHWVPEMVRLAGGEPLLNEAGQPSRKVTWREVADAGPEVIVFMPCGYYLEDAEADVEPLFSIPDFADTPAARTGSVFATDASSYFSRPGPRIVDGLEILAWCIHPEAFPEPPADRAVRVR